MKDEIGQGVQFPEEEEEEEEKRRKERVKNISWKGTVD
jgi:hypothetical protein